MIEDPIKIDNWLMNKEMIHPILLDDDTWLKQSVIHANIHKLDAYRSLVSQADLLKSIHLEISYMIPTQAVAWKCMLAFSSG